MSTRPLPDDAARFWEFPSLDALAREQGVEPVADPHELFGGGADLWADDQEFEEFLAGIYRRRHEEPTGEGGGSATTRSSRP